MYSQLEYISDEELWTFDAIYFASLSKAFVNLSISF